MIAALRLRLDRFRGAGAFSVTVPSMDGAFRPNSLLDQAEAVARLEAPDDLATDGRRLLATDGPRLLALTGGGAAPALVRSFEASVTSLAAHASGAVAVALSNGRIVVTGGPQDGKVVTAIGDEPIPCPTAMAFADPSTLLVCLGSRTQPPSEWKRDLMERGSSGSVWRLDLSTGQATALARGLAFPNGITTLASGAVVVSEAWRHRLVALDGGAPRVVLGDLPGYPARIGAGEAGSHWLCVFAPRRQMIEFVLREREYCDRMMAEVEEPFWMAPSLSSGHSFEEPLQGGAVKHLGIHKPWAPTRSYGLLVRLDAACTPLAGAHSRADGKRHGITGAVGLGGRVYAASRGSGEILALDAAAFTEE